MKATSSELLMRNFNEIFIELDPLKRAALLAESYTEDCLSARRRRPHPHPSSKRSSPHSASLHRSSPRDGHAHSG